MRSYIDARLRTGVMLELDDQLFEAPACPQRCSASWSVPTWRRRSPRRLATSWTRLRRKSASSRACNSSASGHRAVARDVAVTVDEENNERRVSRRESLRVPTDPDAVRSTRRANADDAGRPSVGRRVLDGRRPVVHEEWYPSSGDQQSCGRFSAQDRENSGRNSRGPRVLQKSGVRARDGLGSGYAVREDHHGTATRGGGAIAGGA